ncbi:MAG: hypothetical protein KL785_03585 [Brevundimonas sp.]|nr:hypothetical protein [Brevundimonas sp.]
MRALSRLRFPSGWIVPAVALAVLVIAVGHGLGVRWDPFDLSGRRARAAEARAAVAAADAGARRFESEGMAGQARRLEHLHQQAVTVARETAAAAAQARSASDASIPLDPARADRLLRHDRELCRLAPAACGPAEADPAAGGDPAVRAGPAA